MPVSVKVKQGNTNANGGQAWNTSIQVQSQGAAKDVRAMSIYEFMDDTYSGENGYRDGTYLIPFPKEVFYNSRRQSAFYKNYFQAIVKAMVDPVFVNEPTREYGNEIADTFANDADACGTPLTTIVKNAVRDARVLGSSFVVMDTLPETAQPDTVEAAVDARSIPYVYIRKPQDILTYEHQSGRMVSVTFYEDTIKEGSQEIKRYMRWTAQTWEVLEERRDQYGEKKLIVVASGVHGLGVLPVIPVLDFVDTANLKELPDPPLHSLAGVCHSIYNRESEIRQMEQTQAFSTLCMQDGGQDVVVGPNNYITIPMDAKIAPMYISPEAAHLVNLVNNCNKAKEDMYQIAEQNGVKGVTAMASGVSKEWDFRAHEAVLKRTAYAAKNLEGKIFDLLGLYMRLDMATTTVYPLQFSPTWTTDRLKVVLDTIDRVPPPAVANALWSEFVSEYWRGDNELIDEIQGELEKQKVEDSKRADGGELKPNPDDENGDNE
jgi:hypothetical protein